MKITIRIRDVVIDVDDEIKTSSFSYSFENIKGLITHSIEEYKKIKNV